MRHLRTLSAPRLLLVVALATAIAIVGAAIAHAALRASGPTPAPKALDVAIHDALGAQAPDGVTARITFTNHLFDSSGLTGVPGSSALVSGASGRLWLGGGSLRLELQSDSGDVQIQSDGTTLTIYDASSNTLYKAEQGTIHADGTQPAAGTADRHPPTLSAIDDALTHLRQHWSIDGATPASVAGQPAYVARVAPQHDGGLLGAAELAWDADHGTPLRVGIYAQGDATPVLQLAVTDISYGPLDPKSFVVAPPTDARVVDLTPKARHDAAHPSQAPVTGIAAVAQAVSFPLQAPATLDGLPRTTVRLVDWQKTPSALIAYGQGLGQLVVLEQPADRAAAGSDPLQGLPTVSLDGATGHELATPLGTVLRVTRNGVAETLVGSVPAVAAETAARELHG